MCGDRGSCDSDQPSGTAGTGGGRMRLWEIDGGLHCSIIGTCVSHDDLMRIARKIGLKFPRDVTDHHVHHVFVQSAHIPGPASRAVQKFVEGRYATISRKVRATTDPAELAALWEKEREAGRVAGAYWAFLSHNHVPDALRQRIFGEVHMLSHLLGRTVSRTASLVSDLTTRVDDLEARIVRQHERHASVVAERDAAQARVIQLQQNQTRPTPFLAVPPTRGRSPDTAAALRQERAITAARTRARTAEVENEVLRGEVARLHALLSETLSSTQPACPATLACQEAIRDDIGRRILYIGGRSGAVELLRRVAAERKAELIHHDGGEEMSVKRIDGLVEGCDAVFCPIDSVSHQACLKAKALCRKYGKPFVPLRSSGATSFVRALSALPARP